MIKIFLITMFLAHGAFADNVELKINGEQYYCSKDPNNNGNNGFECENNLKRITQKYSVCKQSYTSSSCFNSLKTLIDANKQCPEVVDFCYKACSESYTSSSCYNSCY